MNAALRWFLPILMGLTAGCTMLPYQAKQKPQLENPRPDIDEVILAPVQGSPHAGDLAAWENQFHHQLLDVSGIRKVDRAVSENDPRLTPSPTTAVLWVTVLDFDAYYPPQTTLEIFFQFPSAPRRAPNSLLDLDRMGREQLVTLGSENSQQRFQIRVAADDSRHGYDLLKFAKAQMDGDRGFDPIDRVLRDSSRFQAFASYVAIKRCFQEMSKQKEGPHVR